MPLKKLSLRPGVNRENTRYTNENGWYESQWMRFRQGTPEKIGGFAPLYGTDPAYVTPQQAPGVSRLVHFSQGNANLWMFSNKGAYYYQGLAGYNEVVGASTSFFGVEAHSYEAAAGVGGTIRVSVADTSDLLKYLVNCIAASPADYPWVRFTGIFTSPYTWPDPAGVSHNYTYQVIGITPSGVGPGYFDIAVSGYGTVNYEPLTVLPAATWYAIGKFPVLSDTPTAGGDGASLSWSASNFGTSVIFNLRGDMIYVDGLPLAGLGGVTAPIVADVTIVSDVSRFVLAFGTTGNLTPSSGGQFDPMLVRWADQETYTDWEPAATNQAGSLQLSRGSTVMAVIQARQELLVWTDEAVYSMQYVGAPIVWTAQLVGDNISIASQECVAYAGGTAYWMGKGKFYKYSGTVQTLRCDLRKYIFEDLESACYEQVFASTNEDFNEIWWWYVSKANTNGGTYPDKYVVYNYLEDVWYYGSDNACAALDVRVDDSTGPIKVIPFDEGSGYYSVAFDTEYLNDAFYAGQGGFDDPVAIPAYITSAEFDLDDGHQFMFVWRMLPDITFAGSDAVAPSVQFALLPMKNSGSGVTNPASVGGDNEATILSLGLEPTYTIEKFTGQVFTRVRARQMMIEISSDGLGVAWQLGSPRLDMRPDGRR